MIRVDLARDACIFLFLTFIHEIQLIFYRFEIYFSTLALMKILWVLRWLHTCVCEVVIIESKLIIVLDYRLLLQSFIFLPVIGLNWIIPFWNLNVPSKLTADYTKTLLIDTLLIDQLIISTNRPRCLFLNSVIPFNHWNLISKLFLINSIIVIYKVHVRICLYHIVVLLFWHWTVYKIQLSLDFCSLMIDVTLYSTKIPKGMWLNITCRAWNIAAQSTVLELIKLTLVHVRHVSETSFMLKVF